MMGAHFRRENCFWSATRVVQQAFSSMGMTTRSTSIPAFTRGRKVHGLRFPTFLQGHARVQFRKPYSRIAATDLSPENTYMALMQGAIHGMSSTTIWVWERTNQHTSDLAGSILHRPKHVMAASKAAMDLMRLAPEVTALQQRKPKVAIVWSIASILFNEDKHLPVMNRIWETTEFLDQPTGFLTERSLAQIAKSGKFPDRLSDVKVVICPGVVNLPDDALAGLATLEKLGCRKLVFGSGTVFDEYNRQREVPSGDTVIALPDDMDARLQVIGEQLVVAA